jgi:hypothetical protein
MSRPTNAKIWGLLCLIAGLLLVVMPLAAQSTTNDQQTMIVLEGIYHVAADGTITVAGYAIAPADAFIPPDIADGDSVIVTGTLMADGVTVQATSIEIESAATPETSSGVTGSAADSGQGTEDNSNGHGNGRGNGNGNGNGRGNGNGNANGNGHGNGRGNGNGNRNGGNEGEDTGESADCSNPPPSWAPAHGWHRQCDGVASGSGQGSSDDNGPARGAFCQSDMTHVHPAGQRLANEFNVPYADVMSLFCDGHHGFGQIMIAYRLAQATGQTVQSILALRDSGEGWGRIAHDLGVNLGQVMGSSARGRLPLGEDGPPGLNRHGHDYGSDNDDSDIDGNGD